MFGKDYFNRPQYSADKIHEEAMKWLDKQDGKQLYVGAECGVHANHKQ